MARNNPKPSEKISWDATGEIVAPSSARKTAGWLFSIKPAAQIFNWFWNLTGLNQIYHNAQVEDWIVIDSDADEGDYATLAAYIADSPSAGNRILVKKDQTVTIQTIIPSDITIKFLDGANLLCATNIATSVLQLGSNIIIEGVLNLILSQAGTTDKAIEYNGDNVAGKINIENSSTGTLTTGHNLNASKTGNNIQGFAQNTGGGTLTNILVDNSTEDSNDVSIVDEPNNLIIRSIGANTFISPVFNTSVSGSAFQDDDAFASAAANKFASSESIKAYVDNQSVFSKAFTSAEQTLTAAGALSLPHSLGSMPSLVQARLICKTAELNYAIGDEVIVNSSTYSSASANNYGMSLNPDATNIDIRFSTIAAIFTLADKTTGTGTDITPANWKLIVRAWA